MTNNKSVNLSLTGSKQNAIYNLTDKPSQSVEVRKGIITLTPIGSMLKDLCPKDI